MRHGTEHAAQAAELVKVGKGAVAQGQAKACEAGHSPLDVVAPANGGEYAGCDILIVHDYLFPRARSPAVAVMPVVRASAETCIPGHAKPLVPIASLYLGTPDGSLSTSWADVQI